MSCHPVKWLWGMIPLSALVAAAWIVGTPVLERDLEAAGRTAMSDAGLAWAKVRVVGRIAYLTGQAPGNSEREEAIADLSTVYGLLKTDTSGLKTVLARPSVARLTTYDPTPTISGTWPGKHAQVLEVVVAGLTYSLGQGIELSEDGRAEWRLKLDKRLQPGTYDVFVKAVDKGGSVSVDGTSDELVINRIPAPKIERVVSRVSRPVLTGRWNRDAGQRLRIDLAGQAYVSGSSAHLRTFSDGRWELTPRQDVGEGTHEVTATLVAHDGRTARTVLPAGLTVDTQKPTAPTVQSVLQAERATIITGRWEKESGSTLRVMVGGRIYELNGMGRLQPDGRNGWKLVLQDRAGAVAKSLRVVVIDAAGNVSEAGRAAGLKIVDSPRQRRNVLAALKARRLFAQLTLTAAQRGKPGLQTKARAAAVPRPRDRPPLPARLRQYASPVLLHRHPQNIVAAAASDTGAQSVRRPDAETKLPIVIGHRLRNVGKDAPINEQLAVLLDVVPPRRPSVNKYTGRRGVTKIGGTWDITGATKLSVSLRGKVYTLGVDRELVSDGTGKWWLDTSAALSEGRHDVRVVTVDAAGNVSRDATRDEIEIDTTPPVAPTVSAVLSKSPRPAVSGKWPAGDAVSLTVQIGGASYQLARDPALSVFQDAWTVLPERPLKEGTYDVVVTVLDRAGNKAQDSTTNEVTIDTAPPPVPVVSEWSGIGRKPRVVGTWPHDAAEKFTVGIGGQTYELGRSFALKESEPGKWVLTVPEALPAGMHDVVAKAYDKAGNVSIDQTRDEVSIRSLPAASKGCQSRFDTLLAETPVIFERNSAKITAAGRSAVARLAKAARGCPSARLEVGGHTDSDGAAQYNLALSERRAEQVATALMARGVRSSRITFAGFGEAHPIADNSTDDGKARNRRIEFTVLP